MRLEPFKLERYFAKYEFSARYLLSSSDCDGYSLNYVLGCAGPEELKLWDNLKLGYTDSAGSLFLREAIAGQYRNITPDEVVVASPGEINFSLMNVLLKPGDEVVCMSPAYQSLYQVALDLGCKLNFWPPEDDAYAYEPDRLAELVNPKTKLLIVNFPHNPTAYLPSRRQLERIVEIAAQNGLLVFSDEMYHQLVHDPADAIPALCDLYDHAVSLWGLAKSFGLAGLRFGWAASRRRDVLQKILAFKDYLSICSNAAGEVLAGIALRHKEKFIAPNLQKIIRNQRLFMEFSRKNPSLLNFRPTRASSTALVELKSPVSASEYCEKLVQDTGIMLLPSEMFDYGSRHVRLGFGRENLPEILPGWQEFIDRHPELSGRR